ncbi:MAG: LacI family transcriptional regulator [Lentisphaerae bacterium]|nr:LacI family transcriptional regulator [Lentisphaerota bacterium]MCP4103635.1 LacI family transcriptional regulator [Lentisphaerota bacterium]
MSVKLKDIAEVCEVNVSTVSRALRGDPRVNETTAKQITTKAAELGYSPNLAARQLVSGRTLNLWLLIPDLKLTIVQEPTQFLSEFLHANGYELLITLYHNNSEKFQHLLEKLSQNVADGAFIIPTEYDPKFYLPLLQKNFPLVFIDREGFSGENTTVTTANKQAAYELVKKCHQAGAKQFILNFEFENNAGRNRQNGALEYICARQLPFSVWPQQPPLSCTNVPTAIIGSSGISSENIVLSISGNVPNAKFIIGNFDFPPTILDKTEKVFVCHQNFSAIAKTAGQLMLDKIQNISNAHKTIEIPPEGIICVK